MTYCKYCYRMIDNKAEHCPSCGKAQGKKLKFNFLVRIVLFFGAFLLYHIVFGSFFPADENNALQAPDWYVNVGIFIGLLAAFFDKLHPLFQPKVKQIPFIPARKMIFPTSAAQSNEQNTAVQSSEQGSNTESATLTERPSDIEQPSITETEPVADTMLCTPADESPEAPFSGSESNLSKSRQRDAIDTVIDLTRVKEDIAARLESLSEPTYIVNHTTDPEKFFASLHFILDSLMYLIPYEKYNLFKGLTPSDNYRTIILNRYSEVSRFIDRAISKNEEEMCLLESAAEKIDYRLCFAEHLLSAFDNANSFWTGNVGEPHYTGNLYVENNYSDILNYYINAKSEKQIFESTQKREENRIVKENQFASVASDLEKLDTMEGHDFEYWCASLLKKIGFTNVEVTQGSGDQGVDILAEKDGIRYAIQCKCYSSDLGNSPVQEVSAGKMMPQYHCQVGAVITNRYFTKGAKDLADATGTLLWDRDWIANTLKSTHK